jgi:glutathione peroxidase
MTSPVRAEFYDIQVQSIDGKEYDLSEYQGEVSWWSTRPRSAGSPAIRRLGKTLSDLQDKGFVLLGMPCNQFGNQEPGTNAEIKSFCQRRYGVTFPLLTKETSRTEPAPPVQIPSQRLGKTRQRRMEFRKVPRQP